MKNFKIYYEFRIYLDPEYCEYLPLYLTKDGIYPNLPPRHIKGSTDEYSGFYNYITYKLPKRLVLEITSKADEKNIIDIVTLITLKRIVKDFNIEIIKYE